MILGSFERAECRRHNLSPRIRLRRWELHSGEVIVAASRALWYGYSGSIDRPNRTNWPRHREVLRIAQAWSGNWLGWIKTPKERSAKPPLVPDEEGRRRFSAGVRSVRASLPLACSTGEGGGFDRLRAGPYRVLSFLPLQLRGRDRRVEFDLIRMQLQQC